VHAGEVAPIAGNECPSMLQGCACDESVGHVQPDLPPDAAGSLRHRSIDSDLPERGQQLRGSIRALRPGEQLGSGYHRVVEAMASGS
jgi:hypothetical protein